MDFEFPDVELASGLEPGELAIHVLKFLSQLGEEHRNPANLVNFLAELNSSYSKDPDVLSSYSEAWMWLQNEGMIAPDPVHPGLFKITGRGERLLKEADIRTYMRSKILDSQTLTTSLAQKALPNFQRGDFDTAVFQAFKEVEVRVREAAQYGDEVYGVNLMRSAFDVQDGPLRDDEAVPSERQAMSDLFAGAIGLLKNPTSHRFVDFTDPQEASEAILLANYLLRIVERRASL